MQNMGEDCFEEITKIDKLQEVIHEYKSVLNRAMKTGVKKFNFDIRQKVKKQVLRGEVDRVSKAQFCIEPNTNCVYITEFYRRLYEIARMERVLLKVVPTLVITEDYGLVFTDEYGVLCTENGIKALEAFESKAENKGIFGMPLFIFKSLEKNAIFLYSLQEFEKLFHAKKRQKGILQLFVHSSGKVSPILRVFLNKSGQTKHFLLASQSKDHEKSSSLFNRLFKKGFISNESIKLTENLTVNDSNLQEPYINSMNSLPSEVLKHSSTILALIQKHLLHKNIKSKSIVADFIKDSSKSWNFLSCPYVQLSKTSPIEVIYTASKGVYKEEEELISDNSFLNESCSFRIINTPKKPQNFKFHRSNAYYSYTNVMDNFQCDLGDKFRRVMGKLDKMRNSKRLPVSLSDSVDKIVQYKSYFEIDRSLNTKKKIVKKFTSMDLDNRPECLDSKFSPIRKIRTSDTDTVDAQRPAHHSYFFSQSSSLFQPIKRAISNLDLIQVTLKNSKFQSVNFLKKYPKAFSHDFEPFLLIPDLSPCPTIPCLKSILSCPYSIQYEKLLISTHKPLKISKSTFYLFTSHLLKTVEPLEIDQSDIKSLKNLFQKVSKYIISNPVI